MNHIIDLILIAFMLLVVFISAKKGLILTVFDIAACIISFVSAKLLSPYAADFLYDAVVKEKITQFLYKELAKSESGLSRAITEMAEMFNFLPDGTLDIYVKEISHNIITSITTAPQLEEALSPLVILFLKFVSFVIISLVFVIILKIIARVIAGFIKSSKLADNADTVLGGILGIFKGLIYTYAAVVIICIISCISQVFAEYAANSYICTFVSKFIGF